MNRFYTLFFILFLYSLHAIFGQSPAPKPKNQDPLKDSVDKYNKLWLDNKTIPFAEQLVAKLKAEKKEESAAYGAALDALGTALNRSGSGKEAEPLLLQGLEVRKKAAGENSLDVGESYNNLGTLYMDMGKLSKADSLYLKSLEIRKKILGETHPDVAKSLDNIGFLYRKMGSYPKSETIMLQALDIKKIAFGENHPDYAFTLSSLGVLYSLMGNYPKAEPLIQRALEIQKKALGDHMDVARSLNNLGSLYGSMGDPNKALQCFLQALEIYKKMFGDNNFKLANLLINIGFMSKQSGNYAQAEKYYLQGLKIQRAALGDLHYDVAKSIERLGIFYMTVRKFSKAEPYMLQALEIKKKTLNDNHPDWGNTIMNIGVMYTQMGDYKNSEPYFLRALEIWKKTLGENHPMVTEVTDNLAIFNVILGKMDEAEKWYLTMNIKKYGQIRRYFPFLSDKEKEKFYEANFTSKQDGFKSFCVERYPGKKAISIEMYNDQLISKGLLLNSSAKWKHRIKTSGDKKLFHLYEEWETSRNHLNKLLQSSDTILRAGIDSVEKKTEKMEKELSLRSENFTRLADKKIVNWKDVQKALKPGDAAIELIRVKKFGVSETITDTSNQQKRVYQLKGVTDTIYYAALIVKPESLYPEMVLLKNGNDLEGKYRRFYLNAISKQIPDHQSYQQFWEKIGARLGNCKRVYLSPDGIYHNLNLNTLFNPKTKKYLLEEKDIRLVTVTKDLVSPGATDEDNKLAELVGYPSYYQSGSVPEIASAERKSPDIRYGLHLESMGNLSELPGTKTEVDKIASILTTKGWEVKNYTGSNALESNIKESYKPRLLHIATHGFFQPDTAEDSNPLLRSGLMLAGAGSTLKGEKSESGEDGILTSFEAMNLNLDNTDLVVLSACETGLGFVKNGEGVYGLQRAFKVAGAKTIIMSLWKVNDEATQELMVRFYKHWLSPPAPKGGANSTPPLGVGGSGPRSAFLAAQKELKAKYPEPYYWGAFVMVGE